MFDVGSRCFANLYIRLSISVLDDMSGNEEEEELSSPVYIDDNAASFQYNISTEYLAQQSHSSNSTPIYDRNWQQVIVIKFICPTMLKYGLLTLREKGRDLTQSCDKNPYTHRTIQKAT